MRNVFYMIPGRQVLHDEKTLTFAKARRRSLAQAAPVVEHYKVGGYGGKPAFYALLKPGAGRVCGRRQAGETFYSHDEPPRVYASCEAASRAIGALCAHDDMLDRDSFIIQPVFRIDTTGATPQP